MGIAKQQAGSGSGGAVVPLNSILHQSDNIDNIDFTAIPGHIYTLLDDNSSSHVITLSAPVDGDIYTINNRNTDISNLWETTLSIFKPDGSSFSELANTTSYTIQYDGNNGQFNLISLIDGSSGFQVSSGTYIPTLTVVSNITGTPTANQFIWSRVENVVTINGSISLTATAASNTEVDFNLPIASDLVTKYDLSGLGQTPSGIAFLGITCQGDAVNNRAELLFNSASIGANGTIYITVQYIIK